MKQKEIDRIDEITARVYALLNGELPEVIDIRGCPQDEIRQLGDFINRLIQQMESLTRTTRGFAEGAIGGTITSSLPPASALKSLQAALKHLTWQTQRVAQGDFSQRVEFLGQFSSAYNKMVEELQASRERLMAQQEELTRLAATDPLTGIFNRRRFFEQAVKEFDRARRFKSPLSVLQMDLDHFKRVNDTFGHTIGDDILKATANVTLGALRAQDIFGRLGGEEFSAVIIQTTQQEAQHIADRIRCLIADIEVPVTGQSPARVTASIGIAQSNSQDKRFEDVLNRADLMLYQAKNNGRNRVMVCE